MSSSTSNARLINLFLEMMSAERGARPNTLDAYRREILPDAELGLGNSIHVNAYRISGLVPGALRSIPGAETTRVLLIVTSLLRIQALPASVVVLCLMTHSKKRFTTR